MRQLHHVTGVYRPRAFVAVAIFVFVGSFTGIDVPAAAARLPAHRSAPPAFSLAHGAAETSQDKPLEISLGASLFQAVQRALDVKCGASVSGGFTPTGDIELTLTNSFVRDSGLGAKGEVGLILTARNFGFVASLQASASCETTLPLQPIDTVAKFGHLKVPVNFKLGLRVSLQATGEVKLSVKTDFRVKAALHLDGLHLFPTDEVSGSGSASVEEGESSAEVSFGPVGGVEFDLPGDVVKADIEGFYPLKASVKSDGSCEISAGVESSIDAAVSLHFLGLEGENKYSWKRNVEESLYKCHPNPKKSGEPGSTGSPPATSSPLAACTGGPVSFALGENNNQYDVEGGPFGTEWTVPTEGCAHYFEAWIPGEASCPTTASMASEAAIATPGGVGYLTSLLPSVDPSGKGGAGMWPAFSGPVHLCLYFFNSATETPGVKGEAKYRITECLNAPRATNLGPVGVAVLGGLVTTVAGQPARGRYIETRGSEGGGSGGITDDQGEWRDCVSWYTEFNPSPSWYAQLSETGQWYDGSSTSAGATPTILASGHAYTGIDFTGAPVE